MFGNTDFRVLLAATYDMCGSGLVGLAIDVASAEGGPGGFEGLLAVCDGTRGDGVAFEEVWGVGVVLGAQDGLSEVFVFGFEAEGAIVGGVGDVGMDDGAIFGEHEIGAARTAVLFH